MESIRDQFRNCSNEELNEMTKEGGLPGYDASEERAARFFFSAGFLGWCVFGAATIFLFYFAPLFAILSVPAAFYCLRKAAVTDPSKNEAVTSRAECPKEGGFLSREQELALKRAGYTVEEIREYRA